MNTYQGLHCFFLHLFYLSSLRPKRRSERKTTRIGVVVGNHSQVVVAMEFCDTQGSYIESSRKQGCEDIMTSVVPACSRAVIFEVRIAS